MVVNKSNEVQDGDASLVFFVAGQANKKLA